jgi:phenylacetate-CoA ligase
MQFVQERPGELELRLVRGAGYTDADTNEILAKLRELLGPLLDVRLTFCDEIPLTARGKHRLLVQRLSRAGGTP